MKTLQPTRDKKLALKMLSTMAEDFPDFKVGLAAFCHLKTTASIDQWIKRGIPSMRLAQLWEFYDEFVSELKHTKRKRVV